MIKLKPYSALFLTLEGFLLAVIGIYFIFLRPTLLPEDSNYIGLSISAIQKNIPGLSLWLQKVFWVMGCFIFTAGLLIMHIAQTSFRARTQGSFIIASISAITTIGIMTIINFIIRSDFKWVLLVFTIPFILSLVLYQLSK
jgi:hypothetical protein